MPRHRRSRRPRFRPPAVLIGACLLASAAALGLATVAPSPSAGARGTVAIPEAAVAHLPNASRAPSGSTATSEPSGMVAGITATGDLAGSADRAVADLVVAAPDPASLTGYRWPIAHPRITLPFGPWWAGSRIVDGMPFHDGLDLATFCGDRIVAAHDGTVIAAGRHYDRQMGWVGDLQPYIDRLDAKSLWTTLPIVVVIDDGNGYRSIYAHFERLAVQRGDHIHAGQLLGYEGQTGHASGCHLHYGLFSPLESGTFGIDPAVVEHMKLPAFEIARIDPLRVLPARAAGATSPVVPSAPAARSRTPAADD